MSDNELCWKVVSVRNKCGPGMFGYKVEHDMPYFGGDCQLEMKCEHLDLRVCGSGDSFEDAYWDAYEKALEAVPEKIDSLKNQLAKLEAASGRP